LEEVFAAAARDFAVAYAGAAEGLLLTLVVAAAATASSWSFFNIGILGIFEAFFFAFPQLLKTLFCCCCCCSRGTTELLAVPSMGLA
jgi:hypothetical protein